MVRAASSRTGITRARWPLTLVVELFIVWAVFMPRRIRIACFAIVTALQVGIIATANYAFLNYLVLDARLSAARRSSRRVDRAHVAIAGPARDGGAAATRIAAAGAGPNRRCQSDRARLRA